MGPFRPPCCMTSRSSLGVLKVQWSYPGDNCHSAEPYKGYIPAWKHSREWASSNDFSNTWRMCLSWTSAKPSSNKVLMFSVLVLFLVWKRFYWCFPGSRSKGGDIGDGPDGERCKGLARWTFSLAFWSSRAYIFRQNFGRELQLWIFWVLTRAH